MHDFQPFTHPTSAFSISLKPIGRTEPLAFGSEFETHLLEKRRLYQTVFDACVMREEGYEPGEEEAASLVSTASRTKPPDTRGLNPLANAALAVPDDLLLLARDESGWRLVSASLCFPSSWRLADKFGQPLEQIHAPVPHMAGQMGERIRRIFDMLHPTRPVWRENWSIEGDGELRHARAPGEKSAAYKAGKLDGAVYIRCEYQTLHKLSETGMILFTVRILVRSLGALAETANGRGYLRHLADSLPGISEEGLAYKGLSGQRERLRSMLLAHTD